MYLQREHEHTRTGNWSESGVGSLRGAPLNTSRCLGEEVYLDGDQEEVQLLIFIYIYIWDTWMDGLVAGFTFTPGFAPLYSIEYFDGDQEEVQLLTCIYIYIWGTWLHSMVAGFTLTPGFAPFYSIEYFDGDQEEVQLIVICIYTYM